MALLYGATGQTHLAAIAAAVPQADSRLLILAMMLICIGLAFKISAVPFHAWQVALAGPAAVAVHDDGNVTRQPIELDLACQRFFRPALGDPLQQLFKTHGVV